MAVPHEVFRGLIRREFALFKKDKTKSPVDKLWRLQMVGVVTLTVTGLALRNGTNRTGLCVCRVLKALSVL